MVSLSTIILAAGKGTRMASRRPKVLHRIAGEPMLHYPLRVAMRLQSKKIVVVLGYGHKQVEDEVVSKVKNSKNIQCVEQKPQLGTAHAVRQATPFLKHFLGDILILYGDVPMVRVETVRTLLSLHRQEGNAMTLLSTTVQNPTGYGRLIRLQDGSLMGIVEERDLKPDQKKIGEIYSGIMVAKASYLFSRISHIKKNKIKKEYYLTDLIAMALEEGEGVGVFHWGDSREVQGINSLKELAEAGHWMQQRMKEEWMMKGVTFIDGASTQLESGVQLSSDVVIGPQVSLRGKTRIGSGTIIDQGSVIVDSVLGRDVSIQPYCVIEESRIASRAHIGPFAHLRPLSVVEAEVHIGNFVELKKTRIRKKAKANHLSYLGDAVIGERSNIGAGTITCNYDGQKKHRTILGPDVFVGSDTQFVAPVTIGRQAYIGAGSTITKNVPAGSLALSRVDQKVIRGWIRRQRS
ncbi:MAG: UDP-N-acetylglucosamine diphosphorylase/glucosamine-1-phosphate N-acetyltransferase [Deltaproteobacteria bacterium RIFCSPLOWO2_02_FULL_50_16]|nr:MAG: UDP-N-acetylglucosamine diphosphorylase/glucosamine-1-phosphate N-acetyltransferase [Deltaproteobacteria bacterium GWA2_50_8]OGQ32557.1 MAG: UDP-N-acetylglucosamine diphosphorylase/glucosamine-1-phosphate N-acetyltransferase [Deltaproteobacteria bacterium RIFCSPHIGHO2_02_FULL_50_15]OGQ55880.1 MAG: UDP-N-acetylglucosamine diphosphorylase/glucosamine-1-phosphate N-acetyltransferase [Deltaproteobacteria bacterium RIFCSPLOWO2_02_FULL_50_16]OGQ66948.1 MAG: UDP-N-acetylglucosamine diphosphoryl